MAPSEFPLGNDGVPSACISEQTTNANWPGFWHRRGHVSDSDATVVMAYFAVSQFAAPYLMGGYAQRVMRRQRIATTGNCQLSQRFQTRLPVIPVVAWMTL